MNIEQEIRVQIEKNRGLKLAVGEINNHLSVLEGLLRNERDDAQKRVDEAYQKGLDDAWECARRISVPELSGGFTGNEMMKIYGTIELHKIYDDNTASEAIEKLKAYEEKQKVDDKIEVGDEVVVSDVGCEDTTYTVVSFGEGTACGFTYDGIWIGWELNKVTKTGRHFDIDKILEEMRE